MRRKRERPIGLGERDLLAVIEQELEFVGRYLELETAFAKGMARDFQPTILPSGLVHFFGLALPFAEAAVGVLIAVGLFQRAALAAGAVMIAVLVFGTALLQRWDTLTQQMIYALVYAALIATRSWDRWSLDAARSASRPPRP